jgi:hypothetical protein
MNLTQPCQILRNLKLSKDWQKYISDNNLWISFFEWRKLNQKVVVQMMGESSEAFS